MMFMAAHYEKLQTKLIQAFNSRYLIYYAASKIENCSIFKPSLEGSASAE